jgi:hypothetical protein
MIHFLHGGHYPFIGPADEVRVRVIHRLEDGYILAKNGEVIREDMPLKELLSRIFRDDRRQFEEELYECTKALARGNTTVVQYFSTRYDQMYARLFKSGKAVLQEHTMSSFNDPADIRRREMERAIMMQNRYLTDPAVEQSKRLSQQREQEQKAEQIKKDKIEREEADIYYLLT